MLSILGIAWMAMINAHKPQMKHHKNTCSLRGPHVKTSVLCMAASSSVPNISWALEGK